MVAMSSLWLIKHPLGSGSHGRRCNLSSGWCVMECGLLQSLSLRVINSVVASKASPQFSEAREGTAQGRVVSQLLLFANGNQTSVILIACFHLELLGTIPAFGNFKGSQYSLTAFGGTICLEWAFPKARIYNVNSKWEATRWPLQIHFLLVKLDLWTVLCCVVVDCVWYIQLVFISRFIKL